MSRRDMGVIPDKLSRLRNCNFHHSSLADMLQVTRG